MVEKCSISQHLIISVTLYTFHTNTNTHALKIIKKIKQSKKVESETEKHGKCLFKRETIPSNVRITLIFMKFSYYCFVTVTIVDISYEKI